MDKRTFIGWFEVGEPLIQQAMLQRVSDYQLRVIAKTRDKNLPHLPPTKSPTCATSTDRGEGEGVDC